MSDASLEVTRASQAPIEMMNKTVYLDQGDSYTLTIDNHEDRRIEYVVVITARTIRETGTRDVQEET